MYCRGVYKRLSMNRESLAVLSVNELMEYLSNNNVLPGDVLEKMRSKF